MNELLPGIEVTARGLRWELVETQPLGEQTLYRLRGLEGAVQGIEIDILSPLEEIIPLSSEINPEKASPLRNYLIYHQAFLLEQLLGSNALLSIRPGRLRIEPYQIVPLMRALKMNRPRLLLCDDVGLGKTIEAALIVTELMARRLAHRVLIVSPAGPLLKQWKNEFLERFGLRIEVLDREKIEEIKRKSELGANPFDHLPIGLVSMDFLKQERILEQIERTTYDIIIIDEAHHCSDLGAGQDYEDSLRRRMSQVLATRCDVLLLLTATPHNGNDRSYASLLELLNFSLVDGKGNIREDRHKPYVVRRLKRHINDQSTGEPKFKERKIVPVQVISDQQGRPYLFHIRDIRKIEPHANILIYTECTEKLLKGIIEEEGKLFKDEGIKYDFSKPEDDSFSTPAVRELLEEIDRSFRSYEKAIKNNLWLGESGINAETNLINEAVQATEEGSRLSNVDLMNFFCDAC